MRIFLDRWIEQIISDALFFTVPETDRHLDGHGEQAAADQDAENIQRVFEELGGVDDTQGDK